MSTVAVGVVPDLLGGGLAVDLGVGLVGELAGQHRALALGDDLLGLGDRALHALGAPGGEDQLGAEGAQQRAALLATSTRASSARRRSRGPRRPWPARCRCCPRCASTIVPPGLQLAGRLGRVDDRDADAVLDRVGRVVELELGRPPSPSAPSVILLMRTSGVLPISCVDVVVDAGHGSSSGGVPRVRLGDWTGGARGAVLGRGHGTARVPRRSAWGERWRGGTAPRGVGVLAWRSASALETATAGVRGRAAHGVGTQGGGGGAVAHAHRLLVPGPRACRPGREDRHRHAEVD